MNFPALKFKAKEKIADALGMFLPETVLARLSGLGEPPQFGMSATLKRIQDAIRCAERGEPYYMNALIRDMVENYPHLQAEIGKRIMSFMGRNETIEPMDKNKPEDVIAAEMIEDMISNCDNWKDGSVHLALGHVWTLKGAEKIYEAVPGSEQYKFRHPVKYRLKKLHPVPDALYTYKVAYWNLSMAGGSPQTGTVPQDVMTNTGAMPVQDAQAITALSSDYMKATNGNPALIWNPDDWHADLRFYGVQPNGMIDWSMSSCYKPDPIRHVLHSANVSTVSSRPGHGGIPRSLLPYWLWTQSGFDWFARAMERYASPFAVAYANTSNKSIYDLLTKAFNQATKNNALIVPPQARIELKEVMVSGMADGYAKFVEVNNTEVTKAILGQTLSTSSKGSGMMGGSGVADLHSDVKEEWALFDKRSYCDMQWKQIFEPYLKINGHRGRCRSVRGGINPAQQALLAKTFQSLYLSGVRVAKEEEQKLTNDFGYKLEVFDVAAEAATAAAKTEKSKADHENPAKGSIP